MRALADGRLEVAAQEFSAVLAQTPDHPEALFNLGNIQARLGRPESAVRYFALAVAARPTFDLALINLGVTLQWLGRHLEAVRCFHHLIAWQPASPVGYPHLGRSLIAIGNNSAAVRVMDHAVVLEPVAIPNLMALGHALEADRRPESAVDLYRRVLACDPTLVQAHFALGNALSALGRHDQAIRSYRAALRFDPGHADAHNNLGAALRALDQGDQALGHFIAALILKPELSTHYNNVANAFQAVDRTGDAIRLYRRAITLAPGDAVAINNLGVTLTWDGQLTEARDAFRQAVALAPRRGHFHRMLAEAGPVDEAHRQQMEQLLQQAADLTTGDRTELQFALAKAYGDAGDPVRSFQHLLEGNRLKRQTIVYDESAALALFERIRAVFTADRMTAPPMVALGDTARPIFVVGMPRSGTTLVEQILASHPTVFGAGELTDLPTLAGRLGCHGMPFPEAVTVLPADQLARLGEAYCQRLRACAPTARHVVDKLPANFQLIGLIRLALPGARIIHIERDPVDTCLSCFSRLFTGPQLYAYDLAELGRYFLAYQTLMAHWRRVLPAGILLDVRYEDLVDDMEGNARRILAHCGLPWDAGCLAFHSTNRTVRTASAAQVRQPLYRHAVGRWHVYGDLARPLVDALHRDGNQ
jgi:tetratricopeptide (TPR) repeat protein